MASAARDKLRNPPSRTVALTGQLDAWGRRGRAARRYGLLQYVCMYASTPQQVVENLEAQRGAAVSTEISEYTYLYFLLILLKFPKKKL